LEFTLGGGWYMEDPYWVRSINGLPIWTDGNVSIKRDLYVENYYSTGDMQVLGNFTALGGISTDYNSTKSTYSVINFMRIGAISGNFHWAALRHKSVVDWLSTFMIRHDDTRENTNVNCTNVSNGYIALRADNQNIAIIEASRLVVGGTNLSTPNSEYNIASFISIGDMSIGEHTAGWYSGVPVLGKELTFNGVDTNNDPVYLARKNYGTDLTSLVINIGDNGTTDSWFIGTTGVNDNDNIDYGLAHYQFVMDGTLINTSDKNLKCWASPIVIDLEKIKTLRGITFHRMDHFGQILPDLQSGLIAQEVEKIYPSLVHTEANGYKYLNYMALGTVFMEVMKKEIDQQTRIRDKLIRLKNELTALKKGVIIEKVNK
ncbi:tail fiber domain-containing protein, partial [Thermoproteota archaeon]